MKNNSSQLFEFFPSSGLNNMSFFLYFPLFEEEEKEKVTEIILKNKGVSQKIIL